MLKFLTLVLLLLTSSGFCADKAYLPIEQQTIHVRYGTTWVCISNARQFMAIRLEPTEADGRCAYRVRYGSIERGPDGSSITSLIGESSGVFTETAAGRSSCLIWPGGGERTGIIRDIFMSWSSANRESGYLYVPTDLKIAVGFDMP